MLKMDNAHYLLPSNVDSLIQQLRCCVSSAGWWSSITRLVSILTLDDPPFPAYHTICLVMFSEGLKMQMFQSRLMTDCKCSI